tara:strand:- start:4429 stop:5019 length:591 start_codon:yes stop_codon:yes gene_type:complete
MSLLIIQGFIAKLIAGMDDTLTHSPLLASLTRTRKGKFVFILGMLTSIIILISIAMFFSGILERIPYRNWIGAGLIFGLAVFIYFDKVVHRGRDKLVRSIRSKKYKPSTARLFQLYGTGILTFFATGVDDVIVYAPLLIGPLSKKLLVGSGILLATLLEFYLIFYFSKYIAKIKYKYRITVFGLIVLSVLVGFEII